MARLHRACRSKNAEGKSEQELSNFHRARGLVWRQPERQPNKPGDSF